MIPQRCLPAIAAIVVAAAIGSPASSAETGHAAAKEITPRGVGGVTLGKTYAQLRQQGLVNRIGKGCELRGPNARSAALRAPLKGSVDFTLTSPRKVASIAVRGGARARGVGVGATIAQIKAAFPKAKVDHSTEAMFGTTTVKIPKGGGGRLEFVVDVKTRRTTLIGIPSIVACE